MMNCNEIMGASGLADLVTLKCRDAATNVFGNGKVTDMNRVIEIEYYIRDTQYTIQIPKRKGPRQIVRITDLEEVNFNEARHNYIMERLGPYKDFHGIDTTPASLGIPQGLKVLYRTPRSWVTYRDDSVILTSLA